MSEPICAAKVVWFNISSADPAWGGMAAVGSPAMLRGLRRRNVVDERQRGPVDPALAGQTSSSACRLSVKLLSATLRNVSVDANDVN